MSQKTPPVIRTPMTTDDIIRSLLARPLSTQAMADFVPKALKDRVPVCRRAIRVMHRLPR